MFKPTYLYIKTHNVTGLKYFGKTTRKNPHSYKGSGSYWVRHINKHGNNVTTEIYGYYTDNINCLADAKIFSEKHNIVESNEWANLKPEALDGGDTSNTEGYKRALSKLKECRKKSKWWNNGIHQTFTEFPPTDTYIRGRLKFNNVGAKLGALVQKEKLWINNSKEELMIRKDIIIPAGYTLGRLHNKAFAGGEGRHSAKGTRWWNNGITSTMSIQSPGDEWIHGRLRK